jgi:hypothetical protein
MVYPAKLQTTLRKMSEPEKAWVGAFIDAEGGFYVIARGTWNVNVVNTEPEFLSALLRATHLGVVISKNNHSQAKKHWKPAFQWTFATRVDVDALAEAIAPYSLKAQEYLNGR